MTKSTITRERLEQLADNNTICKVSWDERIELAQIALAAMDSEPVAFTDERNLGYIDRGRETAYLWGKKNSEASDVGLYRHAQPAPVVPDDLAKAFISAIEKEQDRLFGEDYLMDSKDCIDVIREEAQRWNACRAAMLQAGDKVRDLSTPVDPQVAEYEQNVMQAGNSLAIPDGYVMVPMRLTAENGAKGALSGEFSETKFVNCPECFGDDECETCDGSGRIEITVPVTWTTIKEIWAKGVEHFAAAPQEASSESQ